MNSQGQTENLGQIAVLWISAYQPENNKLIWYDTISRIHKVYETSTGNWVPLNPQIVTNATLDDVRTQAQHYGLSIGKFYYLTDVGSLAVAVSVTKIWYVDSNGNYIVNDLISTVQAYVNSDNLLIDGTKGVYDLVTGKLVFAFTTIENGELVDENNDYIAMRRKNGSVWSWIKLRLKNLISGENGNNITWNKGLYFSLLNSLREIVNHQGGVVGYDSYQSDKQQMTNSINQIAESNRTVLNAAKQYTNQETGAAKIYGKQHSGAWNVVNNPPNTPNAAATLDEILQILVSWTNVLQKAGKINLGSDYAAGGKTGDISAADSVRSAIEKLVYKALNLRAWSINTPDGSGATSVSVDDIVNFFYGLSSEDVDMEDFVEVISNFFNNFKIKFYSGNDDDEVRWIEISDQEIKIYGSDTGTVIIDPDGIHGADADVKVQNIEADTIKYTGSGNSGEVNIQDIADFFNNAKLSLVRESSGHLYKFDLDLLNDNDYTIRIQDISNSDEYSTNINPGGVMFANESDTTEISPGNVGVTTENTGSTRILGGTVATAALRNINGLGSGDTVSMQTIAQFFNNRGGYTGNVDVGNYTLQVNNGIITGVFINAL